MARTIKLGQRVYGVSMEGTIVPTLISWIKFPEAADDLSTVVDNESLALLRGVEKRLDGPSYSHAKHVLYGTLNHGLRGTWLTFEEAHGKALETLKRLMQDESVSVGQQRLFASNYERLVMDKEAVRKLVDEVVVFSKSRTLPSFDNPQDEYVRRSDFPQYYIGLGTPVWIADTKAWQVIRGFVTEVTFAPKWKQSFVYSCGSHHNLQADRVFLTKKRALRCLEGEFEKTLPGTLDPRRVPVVQQVSQTERFKQQLAMFRKLIKQPHLNEGMAE